MQEWLQDVVLESETVRLEPLRAEHEEALRYAAQDGELWRLWFTSVPAPENTEAYIATALRDRSLGLALPFAVVHKPTQQVIGCTRYCNAVSQHRRVEIGYTWYAASHQRSAVNTECKLLLLRHAFESLQTIAVEFRTHWYNQASRHAIARLGAKQDGVLRNHSIEPDGAYRDTVVFSILESEWPSVKKSLAFRLARHRQD
ncbi:MAG: GNAT family N-acetyltransferase [Pseudomonadales bacterium]|nr:GNAT family N-acetyltransferase [Pseudomonadales bacterium]